MQLCQSENERQYFSLNICVRKWLRWKMGVEYCDWWQKFSFNFVFFLLFLFLVFVFFPFSRQGTRIFFIVAGEPKLSAFINHLVVKFGACPSYIITYDMQSDTPRKFKKIHRIFDFSCRMQMKNENWKSKNKLTVEQCSCGLVQFLGSRIEMNFCENSIDRNRIAASNIENRFKRHLFARAACFRLHTFIRYFFCTV